MFVFFCFFVVFFYIAFFKFIRIDCGASRSTFYSSLNQYGCTFYRFWCECRRTPYKSWGGCRCTHYKSLGECSSFIKWLFQLFYWHIFITIYVYFFCKLILICSLLGLIFLYLHLKQDFFKKNKRLKSFCCLHQSF